MADCAIKPLIFDALVKLCQQALNRLVSPQIDFPVVCFLAQIDTKSLECVRGITPFVPSDQTPIQCFISHTAHAQPDGALLFPFVFTQGTFEI